jgi:enoyl-[acyl-carrier-protein] reductase (NADH)
MATVDVTSSRNITAVSYALGDTINVLDGVTYADAWANNLTLQYDLCQVVRA